VRKRRSDNLQLVQSRIENFRRPYFKHARQIGAAINAAILTASLVSAANATDVGDSCCADLESRIADLEATNARKGNRKVSLTISGYVAQELTWWDDGGERNAYLHGLGPTQATHVKISGEAQITPGWTAGYMLRIQNLDDNPFSRNASTGQAMNQASSDFSQGPNVQMSYWYLQNKEFGKVSVGRQANAAKSAAMFTDQSGTQVIDNYTFLAGFPQFTLRSGGDLLPAGMTWGQLGFCYSQAQPLGGDCDGLVMNAVRYDSPVFAGFSTSASWGEDDVWEIAARYAGQLSGFKVLLGVGYSENTDENASGPSVTASKDSNYFQVGGYAQHLATGLFVHAAYGNEDNNGTVLNNGHIAPDSHHWYAKAGIRRKWTPLGATIVYGDYAEYRDQLGPAALALEATSSVLARYGGGIAQEIDAAQMTLYLKVQHYDADVSGAPSLTQLHALELLSVGGLISF
jgi:predicted porin